MTRTHILIIVVTALAASALGAVFLIQSDPTAGIDFVVAKRGSVISEVSVTGRVEPSRRVELAFEGSGRVASVLVDVGDRVSLGMPLVRLEDDDERAALAQAAARVKLEEAKLLELERGPTPEAVAVKGVKVTNADATRTEEDRNLVVALQDAFTKSDDAVRNKVDQFFTGPETSNPQINFSVIDPQLKTTVESTRRDMTQMLNAWRNEASILSIESDLLQAVLFAKDNLDRTRRFLDSVSIAVNAVKTNSNLSQATIDSYRADVATARTNVNTALGNIITAEKKVRDAESAFLLAWGELQEVKAGTRIESIAAQEAKVEEVHAAVFESQVLLEKTVLYSPISGIVTKQDADVGEIVTANVILVSVISDANFEMKVNIPEADITKVSVGDAANVTLDAYGRDVVFAAVVVAVDPAETIIEGVPTYRTTLHFSTDDARIRSGMTANVDILADRRDDVISVPARAIITRNGQRVVRVLDAGDSLAEVFVETGLRGSDGLIEIVNGVEEGDRVVTFIDENIIRSADTALKSKIQQHF